jgi:hypothetical protein
MLDYDITEDEDMVVLEKLAELFIHCLSPRGDERPKESSMPIRSNETK